MQESVTILVSSKIMSYLSQIVKVVLSIDPVIVRILQAVRFRLDFSDIRPFAVVEGSFEQLSDVQTGEEEGENENEILGITKM